MGVTDHEIRRRCTGGSWHRVRRGAYAESSVLAGLDTVARHRLSIAALLPDMACDAVVSHQSAAVVLGAPMAPALLDRVHVTRNRRHGGRIKANLQVHCAPVDLVAERDTVLVTTPARTIVDLARTVAFEPAVVVGDALCRDFGVTVAALAAELEAARGRRGIDAARRVIDFLDPRSRGVDHSRIRVLLQRLGLPPAAASGLVHAEDGSVLGSVDLYLEHPGVVLTVYGSGPDTPRADHGAAPADTVLRHYGFHPVRVSWRELATGTAGYRLQVAVREARAVRPRGFIRPAPLFGSQPLTSRSLRDRGAAVETGRPRGRCD